MSHPAPGMNDYWLSIYLSELILLGLILYLFGALAWTFPRSASRLLQNRSLQIRVAALLLLILWLPVLFAGRSAEIAGERFFWLADDGMISMRYARNLAQGWGLVWNPGERVEGYTNLLWTLALALLHLFPISDAHASLAVMLVCIALAVATLPFLARLGDLFGLSSEGRFFLLLGFVFSRPMMLWTLSGLETPLLTFLTIASLELLLMGVRANRVRAAPFLLASLMGVVRADGLVIALLLGGLTFALHSDRKRVLLHLPLLPLFTGFATLFRLYYYGEWVPNTATLKTTLWDGRLSFGLGYVFDFILNHGFLFLFALVGLVKSRIRAEILLFGVFLALLAYTAYAGGDAFPHYRFLTPMLPVLWLLALRAVDPSSRSIPLPRPGRLLLILGLSPLVFPGYLREIDDLYIYRDRGNVEIGLWIKEQAPNARVADFWAGSTFYFSHAWAIDLLGKSDPVIARTKAHDGDGPPGHNKFDYDYSLTTHHPDLLISVFPRHFRDETLLRANWKRSEFGRKLIESKVFLDHCRSHPVPINGWRALFACDFNGDPIRWVQPDPTR